MGIRRGFLLGFLVGSAAGSVLSQEKTAEAPEGETPPGESTSAHFLEGIRERIRAAIAAAHEARAEKERELSRRFEEMKGQRK
jgi:hypothetical protein